VAPHLAQQFAVAAVAVAVMAMVMAVVAMVMAVVAMAMAMVVVVVVVCCRRSSLTTACHVATWCKSNAWVDEIGRDSTVLTSLDRSTNFDQEGRDLNSAMVCSRSSDVVCRCGESRNPPRRASTNMPASASRVTSLSVPVMMQVPLRMRGSCGLTTR
jgi:hypothetical protein